MAQDSAIVGWLKLARRPGRAAALTGLLVVQVVCVGFFLIDVLADLLGWIGLLDGIGHHYFELTIVSALGLSTAATVVDMRRLRARQRRMEAQLRVASGAFMELLEEHFDAWALTPSERDVALLLIKGLSIAEIAEVRRTKEGTVKAQCNAIYSKGGVTGRQQLLSLFIEELMAEGVGRARVPA
jgi:DNA-binding CsgD family transcriptional regulator